MLLGSPNHNGRIFHPYGSQQKVIIALDVISLCSTLWYGFETYSKSLIYSKVEIQKNWKNFNVRLILQ
jgi:hypothetical protein